jgi:Leucine-rich repeat (LRR) protein
MNTPNDPNRNALIRRPSTDLTTISTGDRIVSRMVGEALEIARRQAIQAAKRTIKLGNFDLCEPDYRQIVRWAETLGRTPRDFLDELSEITWQFDKENSATFRVDGGSIKELAWDFDLLPIEKWEWEAGLEIEVFSINSGVRERFPNWSAPERLPSLRMLNVSGGRLSGRWLMNDRPGQGPLFELDLAGVPELTALCLENVHLAELDLSSVPKLQNLTCISNQLTELDLSPVPGLKNLACQCNPLTELDLSPVPRLTRLVCWLNQITELDLSPVPELTILECGANQLTELDLSPVPRLTKLMCRLNQITELDLSPVPGLTYLDCRYNQLTKLELSPVPELTALRCNDNELTELDLSPVPGLTELRCGGNQLTELDLRPLKTPRVRLTSDESVHIIRESN